MDSGLRRNDGNSKPRRHVLEPCHLFAMRIHDPLHLFATQCLTPLVGAALEEETRLFIHRFHEAVLLFE